MTNLKDRLNFVKKFDLSGFRIIKEIGRGRYGIVYHAQKMDQHIALKKFNYPRDLNDQLVEKYIEREITCLHRCRTIDHKFVISLLGISFTDVDGSPLDHPCIITNLVKNGTLNDLLNQIKNNQLEFPLLRKILLLRAIAKGFEWMHSKNVVHRDVKPENILIDENYNPLIADFGTCRFIDEDNYYSEDVDEQGTVLGTITYEAPEVLNDENLVKYMDKTDVFSYAMIMYTHLTGKMPYEDLSNQSLFGISTYIIDGGRFLLPSSVPSYFRQLITLRWDKDPSER